MAKDWIKDWDYDKDPRGPGLAVYANKGYQVRVVDQIRNPAGGPDIRLDYPLPSDDPDAWNMAWRGPYVPTRDKTKYFKNVARAREAARKEKERRAKAKLAVPEVEPEELVVVENKNSIIAGAVLVLILLLFLGSVVQLKDGSQSPWKVAISGLAAWFWGMVAYFQALWVRATSWPTRTATPVWRRG